MKRRSILLGTLCATAGLTPSSSLLADAFPSGPVRLIGTFPAGSGPDAVTRMLAQSMSARWKQPVVVDNRPGAAGFIAFEQLKAAQPTGHDLLVADVGNLSINPSLFKKLPYDPVRDISPISTLYRTAFFIGVGSESPWTSISDIVAAAKNKPGGITYGSFAIGSTLHLGGAMLEHATQSKMTHVPFKDSALLYASVASGQVDFAFCSIASAGPLLKAGKMRFLAVADRQRSSALLKVPTLAEAGGPAGLYVNSWVALVAPANTPPAPVQIINQAVADAFWTPDIVSRMEAFGFTPVVSDPQTLTRLIRDDKESYAAVVRRLNLSLD